MLLTLCLRFLRVLFRSGLLDLLLYVREAGVGPDVDLIVRSLKSGAAFFFRSPTAEHCTQDAAQETHWHGD